MPAMTAYSEFKKQYVLAPLVLKAYFWTCLLALFFLVAEVPLSVWTGLRLPAVRPWYEIGLFGYCFALFSAVVMIRYRLRTARKGARYTHLGGMLIALIFTLVFMVQPPPPGMYGELSIVAIESFKAVWIFMIPGLWIAALHTSRVDAFLSSELNGAPTPPEKSLPDASSRAHI